MGVNTCMAIKLDPVDLMVYADIAQAFENWLLHNPESDKETDNLRQSRIFAKSYLNLYVTFLSMVKYVPHEEINYESRISGGETRKFENVHEIYTDLKAATELSKDEKQLIDESIKHMANNVKPTLH